MNDAKVKLDVKRVLQQIAIAIDKMPLLESPRVR